MPKVDHHAAAPAIGSGMRKSARPIHRILLLLVAAAIAWGAFAFGAVYPWAFTPLALVCALTGVVSMLIELRGRPRMGALSASLGLIALAIALQLAPLSQPMISWISPGTDAFLTRYDLRYIYAQTPELPPHPMSIAPDKTRVALGLYSALAVFLLGTSRLISVVGARPIARIIVGLGVILAIVGVIQGALTADVRLPLIYGFWKPQYEARPFGPFVNPNHFGGWMLMALPVAFALLFDEVMRMIKSGGAGDSRQARMGGLVVLAFAPIIMGLSLLMTRSRTAAAAFGIGAVLMGWTVFRRQKTALGKSITAAVLLAFVVGTFAWAGLDSSVGKFMNKQQQNESASGRLGAWADTMNIIRDFPVAGSGLDTYGIAMIVYQTGSRQLQFQETHNDYLQLASEGGLLVGIPILVAICVFMRDVRWRFVEAPKDGTTYWLRVGATIGLVSIALQSVLEFSLQMPGNAALFVVLAAIALHQSPNLRRVSSGSHAAIARDA